MFALSDKMYLMRGWTAAWSEAELSEDLAAEEYLIIHELGPPDAVFTLPVRETIYVSEGNVENLMFFLWLCNVRERQAPKTRSLMEVFCC